MLVYQSQWFWLLIVLGVIYFFVGRGIVPKVEATVDQRDAKIADDLAEAERLREEADQAEESWRDNINSAHAEAQALVAAAKDKAAKDTEKRLAAADKRLAKKLDEAAASLDEARKSALAEVEAIASDAAREMVTKLAGVSVSETDARAAVAGAFNRA
jgi:F-type H+-transporting ATPase subunit b